MLLFLMPSFCFQGHFGIAKQLSSHSLAAWRRFLLLGSQVVGGKAPDQKVFAASRAAVSTPRQHHAQPRFVAGLLVPAATDREIRKTNFATP